MSKYMNINRFGPNSYTPENNPLSFALPSGPGQKFLHGSSAAMVDGPYSKASQIYMSSYCSDKWDTACQLALLDGNQSFPNQVLSFEITPTTPLTSGEILLRNTASQKYLRDMIGNWRKEFQPFDPTIASSPLIAEYVSVDGNPIVPVYAVNPETIDDDPVMDRILVNPQRIAPNLLFNIYNTLKRDGTLAKLQGTKLGKFYQENNLQL